MEIRVETLTGQDALEVVRKSGLDGYGHRERIEQYKAWMLGGKWALFYNGTSSRFINDPLMFLPNGILYEGKHRIIALSELPSDFGAQFWVLRDFDQIETFRRWVDDIREGRLPKTQWESKSLPAHPRAMLRGEADDKPVKG